MYNNFMLGMTAATLANLTDLGFLWFREFYLETSRVIQVDACSTYISQVLLCYVSCFMSLTIMSLS